MNEGMFGDILNRELLDEKGWGISKCNDIGPMVRDLIWMLRGIRRNSPFEKVLYVGLIALTADLKV